LLSSHAYRGLMNQLGVFESIKIDNEAKEVVAKPKWFVGEGNPEADWGWKLAEHGVAAFSIGFIPKKSISYDEEARAKNGGIYRDFEEIELLEVSQVLIPANPSALQKSFGDPKDDLFLQSLSIKILEAFKGDAYDSSVEEVKWEEPPAADSVDETIEPDKKTEPDKKDDEVVDEIKHIKVTVDCDELKKVLEDFVGEFNEIKTVIAEFKEFVASMKKESAPEEVKTLEPEPEKKEAEPEKKDETPTIEDTLGEEKMAELRASLFGSQDKGSNMDDLKVMFTNMTNEVKEIFSVQQ
jgi:hypothetical protein